MEWRCCEGERGQLGVQPGDLGEQPKVNVGVELG